MSINSHSNNKVKNKSSWDNKANNVKLDKSIHLFNASLNLYSSVYCVTQGSTPTKHWSYQDSIIQRKFAKGTTT